MSNSVVAQVQPTPEERDQLIPVIAVVNYAGPNQEALIASWNSFHDSWPNRPFCVLSVLGANDLLVPQDMKVHPNFTTYNARRDYGEIWYQSDWFDLCNLYNNSVSSVALLISISNIYKDKPEDFAVLVSASADYFDSRLSLAGQEAILVSPQDDGNWIEPLDSMFLATPSPTPLGQEEAVNRVGIDVFAGMT